MSITTGNADIVQKTYKLYKFSAVFDVNFAFWAAVKETLTIIINYFRNSTDILTFKNFKTP